MGNYVSQKTNKKFTEDEKNSLLEKLEDLAYQFMPSHGYEQELVKHLDYLGSFITNGEVDAKWWHESKGELTSMGKALDYTFLVKWSDEYCDYPMYFLFGPNEVLSHVIRPIVEREDYTSVIGEAYGRTFPEVDKFLELKEKGMTESLHDNFHYFKNTDGNYTVWENDNLHLIPSWLLDHIKTDGFILGHTDDETDHQFSKCLRLG